MTEILYLYNVKIDGGKIDGKIYGGNAVEPHFSEHPWDQAFMFVCGGV